MARLNSRLRQLAKLKCFELYASGSSIRKISEVMCFSVGKTHSIVKSINEDCRKELEHAIVETMPIEYQSSITLHKAVMAEALTIAHDPNTKDPRVKLEAMRLALECRRYLDTILCDAEKVGGYSGGVGSLEVKEGWDKPTTTTQDVDNST